MTASRHFSIHVFEEHNRFEHILCHPCIFQVHGFGFAYGDDLDDLYCLMIGFKKLGLYLNAEILHVFVIAVACYALYPIGFIPRNKYCYVLRVESVFSPTLRFLFHSACIADVSNPLSIFLSWFHFLYLCSACFFLP